MKKKLLILIPLLLFVFGLYYFSPKYFSNVCERTEVGGIVGERNECRSASQCLFPKRDKDLCFLGVAAYQKDSDFCNRINNKDIRNECYVNLAGVLKNKEFCSLIDKSSEMGSYYLTFCEEGKVFSRNIPPDK